MIKMTTEKYQEFTVFEDDSQRAFVYVKPAKSKNYFEIGNKLVSVKTNDLQNEDSFEIHKEQLLELADWIQKNLKIGDGQNGF